MTRAVNVAIAALRGADKPPSPPPAPSKKKKKKKKSKG